MPKPDGLFPGIARKVGTVKSRIRPGFAGVRLPKTPHFSDRRFAEKGRFFDSDNLPKTARVFGRGGRPQAMKKGQNMPKPDGHFPGIVRKAEPGKSRIRPGFARARLPKTPHFSDRRSAEKRRVFETGILPKTARIFGRGGRPQTMKKGSNMPKPDGLFPGIARKVGTVKSRIRPGFAGVRLPKTPHIFNRRFAEKRRFSGRSRLPESVRNPVK